MGDLILVMRGKLYANVIRFKKLDLLPEMAYLEVLDESNSEDFGKIFIWL